jgi:hypothetical protein
MNFFQKSQFRIVIPLATMASVLLGVGVYFFQQREVFSEISRFTTPPKAQPTQPEAKLTASQPPPQRAQTAEQGRAGRDEPSSAKTPLTTPPTYEEPKPEELRKLLPEEIRGAVVKEGGYVLTTSFGAKWYVTEAQVEQMPYDQQILIDYGRYKREEPEKP